MEFYIEKLEDIFSSIEESRDELIDRRLNGELDIWSEIQYFENQSNAVLIIKGLFEALVETDVQAVNALNKWTQTAQDRGYIELANKLSILTARAQANVIASLDSTELELATIDFILENDLDIPVDKSRLVFAEEIGVAIIIRNKSGYSAVADQFLKWEQLFKETTGIEFDGECMSMILIRRQ